MKKVPKKPTFITVRIKNVYCIVLIEEKKP